MPRFAELARNILQDQIIDDLEVTALCAQLAERKCVDLDEVHGLVTLYCDASKRSPEFEDLFFAVMRETFLADGEILPSEQFYLLKMLYSDREVRPRELEFLRELKRDAKNVAPGFMAIFEEAMSAHPTRNEA